LIILKIENIWSRPYLKQWQKNLQPTSLEAMLKSLSAKTCFSNIVEVGSSRFCERVKKLVGTSQSKKKNIVEIIIKDF
jgi:hypothetical protein